MLTDLIYYDLKVAALIAVFYLFYMLLLARETTHKLNRFVLLLGIVLSVILPLCIITIHAKMPSPQPLYDGRGEWLLLPSESPTEGLPVSDSFGERLGLRLEELLAVILLMGMGIRLLYLAKGIMKLNRIIRCGERHTLPSDTHVCVVDAPIAPFSWMQTVVLSRADWKSQPDSILAHEEAHVRHRHSYDVVVVELLTALQWFNPVVWFMRQELRTLHEYEADASVLSRGFDESQYIHLLMQKATGIQACALANGIHTQKTKKRIFMMLKPKSNRTTWLKALYVVPIVLVSLAMTARTVIDYEVTEDNRAVRVFNEKTNGRGESYQIRTASGVKFYNNGKEETIPSDRSIALAVKNTTMQLDGVKFDENSLPDLPISALQEIHLDQTSPDNYVCNLVTAEPVKYSSKMSDTEFVVYVKQQQAAGLTNSALTQLMLNEGRGISRAHILHLNSVYGSKKSYLFVVDGKEMSSEEFCKLSPEAIASAKVMDVGPARKAYGEKGSRGATVVKTRQAVSEAPQQQIDGVFDIVEQMPQFPGGDAKLMEFIARNIKYPEAATEWGVMGRVMVKFIVEKDGSVSNAKVAKTMGLDEPSDTATTVAVVSYGKAEQEHSDAKAQMEGFRAGKQALIDEAIRVVKAMPKWKPAMQNGQVVRCHYVIPVTYRLN